MQNIPLLQNSSNNFSPSPIKHAISAGDADDMQRGSASFDKVLAHEMNGKYEAAEAKSANTGTGSSAALNNVPENTGAIAEDLKDLNDSRDLKDSEDLKDLDLAGFEGLEKLMDAKSSETSGLEAQEKTETKSDVATITIVATSPQFTQLTGTLPGLTTMQPHHPSIRIAAGNRIETSVEDRLAIPPEDRTEVPIDAGTDIRTAAGADATGDAQADPRAGTRADAPQAEPATDGGQHAAIAVIQSGPVNALGGKAGIDVLETTPTIPGDLTPRTSAALTTAAVAPARGKHAAVTKEIQDEAALKLASGTPQRGSQQVEFNSPEFGVAGQGEKPEKTLLELAPKEVHATGLASAPATPAIFATEQNALPAAAGSLVHTALWLEPRIGAPGWDNALGQKVLWMVSNQQQVAELNLDPPDLGPLQVILSVTDDQASATFVSQHADVRQALEAALPRLKEMMAESGISLGNTTVSADTPQQQGGFEGQHRPGAHRHGGGGAIEAPDIKSVNSTNSANIGMGYIDTGRSRLVDTFA